MSTTKPGTAKSHMDSPQQTQQGQGSGAKQQGDHNKSTGGAKHDTGKGGGH